MNDLLTRLWRLGKPLQWRFLWLTGNLTPSRFCRASAMRFLPGSSAVTVQATSEKAARQLAASAPDLEDMIPAPDPCDPASLIDEFVGISRTVTVAVSRDLIEGHAVTTRGGSW